MSELRHWIALSLVPEIGPVLSRRLVAAFGSPAAVFSADERSLGEVAGMGQEKVNNILGFSHWAAAERCLKECEKKGIRIVACEDETYPGVLREVAAAPPVLYIKGEYIPEDRYAIAVVGSRKHTDYGETVALKFSGELAGAGFTIVSGMARGIDTLAHESALSSGGRTLAILGSGIDVPYPPENRRLIQRVSESGALISEFPPGTMPLRENFPRRNRLISGLSLGVLVVEATAASGSLITANYALEQNREVFAVPGNITSETSVGTNRLIRQGAKAVLDTDDIVSELAPALKGFIRAEAGKAVTLSADESRLCASLTREPRHVDTLSREVALPVQKMLDMLLMLELKGVVRQLNGKRFYLS